MRFTQAIHRSADGYTITSCKGVTYTPEQLQAQKLGAHAATCKAIVSLEERKGKWQ